MIQILKCLRIIGDFLIGCIYETHVTKNGKLTSGGWKGLYKEYKALSIHIIS